MIGQHWDQPLLIKRAGKENTSTTSIIIFGYCPRNYEVILSLTTKQKMTCKTPSIRPDSNQHPQHTGWLMQNSQGSTKLFCTNKFTKLNVYIFGNIGAVSTNENNFYGYYVVNFESSMYKIKDDTIIDEKVWLMDTLLLTNIKLQR